MASPLTQANHTCPTCQGAMVVDVAEWQYLYDSAWD